MADRLKLYKLSEIADLFHKSERWVKGHARATGFYRMAATTRPTRTPLPTAPTVRLVSSGSHLSKAS